jgi:hypothetical protein
MIDRINDWKKFNDQMEKHIKHYTLLQYDNPQGNDQVENWTPRQCMDSLERYINRFQKNARGKKEQLRDMLKIAHYAQFIYDKLKKEYNEEDLYIEDKEYHGN